MRPNALLLVASLFLAACTSTVYEDKLPPDDYFDPDTTAYACQPKTCDTAGQSCGRLSDACGGFLNCGGCASPDTCGGGGTQGECGCTTSHACQTGACGSLADGCGGIADCSTCTGGLTCGAGGHVNECGTGTCTAETDAQFCARLGKGCSSLNASDNCGVKRTVASCGTCPGPQTCSAKGICACLAESDLSFCLRLGKQCGIVAGSDNCGAARTANCGRATGQSHCSTYGSGSGSQTTPDTGYQKICPTGQTACGTVCCYSGEICNGGGVCQVADACNGICTGTTPVCEAATAHCKCSASPDSCGTGSQCIDDSCCATPCSGACCGAGQTCTGGTCQGTCTGLTCNGVCCASGQTCVASQCHTPDACNDSCSGTTPVCDGASHACQCNQTSCGAGAQCVGGSCQALPGADAGVPPDSGTPSCPEAQRLCAHLFSYQGTGSDTTAEVRGTFPPPGASTGTSWSKGVAMTKNASNLFSVSVPLPWNTQVEYKFFLNGTTWIADPANPGTTPPNYNSVLAATTCPADFTCAGAATCTPACSGETPSCNTATLTCECTSGSCPTGKSCDATTKACKPNATGPALVLVAQPTLGAASYSFQVKFIPGTAKLDLANTAVALNGAPVTLAYTPSTTDNSGTYDVSATGVTPTKYAYLFRGKDLNGVAVSLFVPFWVEAASWTWKDAFLYQIMTDRFANGTTSNDAPLGGAVDWAGDWQGGDFRGIIQKIEGNYFDLLGVTALWISSPIRTTTSPEPGKGANTGHQFSGYHAYWPIATGWTYETTFSQFTTPIEPHFGSADDLKELVAKAHLKGIRVLVDFVPNHVHTDWPLYAAHQSDGAWFNLPYHDCGNENLWDVSPPQIPNRETCWFDPFLPDFNTANSTVQDTIATHAVWLVEEFNLDGFRVDATKHVDPGVLVDLRARINAVLSTGLHFYMVGETLGGNEGFINECMGDNKLDGSVNDPLHNAMVNSFLNCSQSLVSMDDAVNYDESKWTSLYPNALMGHFYGSHDVPRALSIANGDNTGAIWSGQPQNPDASHAFRSFGRLRLAQAFLLTYDPIPIIWMGDEYGMPGAADPDNRRMTLFGGSLSTDQQSALGFAQKLGTARKAHPALRHGARRTLAVSNDFYAYSRWEGTDAAVVVMNRLETPTTQSIPLMGLAVSGTLTDALGGASATVSGANLNVTVGALTAAIYVK